MTGCNLIFVDEPGQAHWLKTSKSPDSSVIVALTAEAWDTCQRLGINSVPICDYADNKALIDGLDELVKLVSFLTMTLDTEVRKTLSFARDLDLWPLTDNWYRILLTAECIVARGFYISKVIESLHPVSIQVFARTGNHRLLDLGLGPQNIMLGLCREIARDTGVLIDPIEWMPISVPPDSNWKTRFPLLRQVYREARLQVNACTNGYWRIHRDLARVKREQARPPSRVLLVDGPADWGPVLDLGTREGLVDPWQLVTNWDSPFVGGFSNMLRSLYSGRRIVLDQTPGNSTEHTEEVRSSVSRVFEEIVSSADLPKVLGLDIGRFLLKGPLQGLCLRSLAEMPMQREMCWSILSKLKPNAILFFAIPGGPWTQLAREARKAQIPVFAYQHGGGYGVANTVQHLVMDMQWSDYHFSYGAAVSDALSSLRSPISAAAGTFHCTPVPLGSARLESIRKHFAKTQGSTPRSGIRLLYITDWPNQNLYHLGEFEDTAHSLLQRKVVDALAGRADVQLIYRPFPARDWIDPTETYIYSNGFSNVLVDRNTALPKLIAQSHACVLECAFSTTLGEVLALGRPYVAYLHPGHPPLDEKPERLLNECGYVARSPEGLLQQIEYLIAEIKENEGGIKDTANSSILREYYLPKTDGSVARSALNMLLEVSARHDGNLEARKEAE